MNLYFLVEGKTERKVYPRWLSYFTPSLTRINIPSDATTDCYFLISGGGFPGLLDIHLPNAIEDVNNSGRYDYLLVILDADEVSVEERTEEVRSRINAENVDLGKCQLKVIVQNRCMETWFLGNSSVYSRFPTTPELLSCTQFYNVSLDDPELMHKPNSFTNTCAQFHYKYLSLMLAERHICYTKSYPRDVVEEHYIQQLLKRLQEHPDHLSSLRTFVKFCTMVNEQSPSVLTSM